MKNQAENCDKEKRALGLFSTGYGSSDHLILCPVELFTKCFMTIVLQLPRHRSVTKNPNTSVDVCRYLRILVWTYSLTRQSGCPWLPMLTRQSQHEPHDDCDPLDPLPKWPQVDCRSNDLFAFVFRNKEYGAQAMWASLQLAFIHVPTRCVPRVGHTGSKTSSRHSLLQWLEQEPLSCFDL